MAERTLFGRMVDGQGFGQLFNLWFVCILKEQHDSEGN